jgi:hypothetical protein
MSTHKLVRIKPSNNREVHGACGVTIKKSDGWCRVPTHVADELAKERMNELNPMASAHVFDVYEEDEAKEVAELEAIKEEPAGTIDRPKDKAPAEPAQDEPRASRRPR